MKLTKKNILVIGDIIHDRYVMTTPRGISAETPTIVGNFVEEKEFAGGAGFVANNLATLGCDVTLIYFADEIEYYSKINNYNFLLDSKIKVINLSTDRFKINEKIRYFCNDYKIFQVDNINQHIDVKNKDFEDILSRFSAEIYFDGIVICDNGHGTFKNYKICEAIKNYAKNADIMMYIDCQYSQEKPSFVQWLVQDNSMFFVNQKEYSVLHNNDLVGSEYEVRHVIKLGKDGCEFSCQHFEGYNTKEVDTCGAGDAFMAAFIASDCNPDFANYWASKKVELFGIQVPDKKYIKEYNIHIEENNK